MLQIIKTIFIPYSKWIIAGVIGLLALLKARQSGQEVERRKQALESLKGARESAKIENTVDDANDTEYKRLYKKWSR